MVDRMGVRELVGQMFVVSVGGTEPDYYIEKMVRERNIGGVLLFGYNMESEDQVRSLTASLQELSMQTEPAVPLFVAVDQEGGEIASAPWVSLTRRLATHSAIAVLPVPTSPWKITSGYCSATRSQIANLPPWCCRFQAASWPMFKSRRNWSWTRA